LQPEEAQAFEQAGLSVPVFAAYITALDTCIAFVFALMGLALSWLRPEDRAALLMSIVLIGAAMVIVGAGMFQPQWHPVVIMVHAIFGASVMPTLYLFPDGRFVSRWTRWLTVIWLMYTVAWLIFPFMSPPFAFGRGLTGSELPRMIWFLLWASTGLASLIYRYFKVSSAIQRQQIKWVMFGYAIGFIAFAIGISILTFSRLAPLGSPAVVARLTGVSILLLGILLIPVSIGVSLLRYRLFDVDIIINRTLVYGALTGIVVSAFVVLVGFLSTLFQSSGNSIIAILATGLVALFFNPLRQRLQLGVNRLMYGERDDPYAVLSRLGQRLEAAYAPESVLPTIVETVAQTLKLPYVAIALNQGGEFKIAAEFGRSKLEPIDLPLIYQGEPVGELILVPRAPGEHFTAAERQLLDDLARQAGGAAHAVRLTADLQRSRERLVAAREEERRRLRRDLHDGLGPQLASLALKLEAARNRMADDPQAVALLTDLSARTQEAVADIRRLVYALRPPALDELGLLMALREGATQYNQQGPNGLCITFDAPESLPPLPAAVEVATYRIAQEALTNVVRHAQARTCIVRLRLDTSAGLLCLDVQDDGKGMPMERRAGVGLNSMRERAEELGGSLMVTSNSTGGTRLTARLPCRVTGPSHRADRKTSSVPPEEV
jgi:signal transduction histidine kinase